MKTRHLNSSLSRTQATPPLHRLRRGSLFISWPPKPQSPPLPPLQPPHPGPRHPWEQGHPWHLKLPTSSRLQLSSPLPCYPFVSASDLLFSNPSFPSQNPMSSYQHPPVPLASLVAQMVKRRPALRETWVQSLGREDSPGEGNGNPLQYSPWTEEPGGLQFIGSQTVRHH